MQRSRLRKSAMEIRESLLELAVKFSTNDVLEANVKCSGQGILGAGLRCHYALTPGSLFSLMVACRWSFH